MVCGESGLVFVVIKPASTTFPHCLVCCKFCSSVQELDCLFWSIYFSSDTFVPLKTALFRDRDKPRERCLASRSFSLLWLFALTKSFASFVSRVWAERKKKRDEHSAAQDAFPLCQISLGFGIDFVTQRIYKGVKSGFSSFIAGVQDPEAFCHSNPQAKSVHTVAATTANVCLRWMKLLVRSADLSIFFTILNWPV